MTEVEPFNAADTRLRPLATYCDRLPSRRRGRKLNRATLWRWAMHGARNGRVRLQTVVLGSGRFTSDVAVAAFMAALRGPEDDDTSPDGAPDDERHRAIRERFEPGQGPDAAQP